MRIENPYHEGERAVQERARELHLADRNGRAIADTILPGAMKFLAERNLAVLGSRDPEGNLWASLLFGRPGFMQAVTNQRVDFSLEAALVNGDDPLWANVAASGAIGALIIDFATRRRLRLNGRVTRQDADGFRLDVHESFPNCPKHIQRRIIHLDETAALPQGGRAAARRTLADADRSLLAAADTLFVASAHPERGVDASHRGGRPGFIQVIDETRIRIPDYSGNSMFNTLGNFESWPRAGVVVPDFARGRALQITGRPEIIWDLHETDTTTGGTHRAWDLHVERCIGSPLPTPLGVEELEASPHNP